MRSQGIKTIITTPHLRASAVRSGRADPKYLELVDRQWALLRDRVGERFADLRLERGFEILLDVPDPDLSDPTTRLAGTKFLLVEFPFASIPPNSERALFDIRMKGFEPIIAHPERYADIQTNPSRLERWLRTDVKLQINAGSLVGAYGPVPQSTAWLILANGWASYLSSDFHAVGECATKAAIDAISRHGGMDQIQSLCTINPERILSGEAPLAVDPLARKGLLKRMLANIRLG